MQNGRKQHFCITTNGVLTYPELEQFIRTFTQFIPLMYGMPEDYGTFSTGVIHHILFQGQ